MLLRTKINVHFGVLPSVLGIQYSLVSTRRVTSHIEQQLSCDWSTSGRVTPRDRRNTNQGVRTQGTIELTKMSGYRPTL